MIELVEVDAGYGRSVKLHSIQCCLEKGTIVAVIGPNGSGKSTLLKTIMGRTTIAKGKVLLDGREMCSYKKNELAKAIAFLPQNRNVSSIMVERMLLHGRFPYLTYPRRYSGKDYEFVENALNKYHLTDLRYRPLYELSGGERQKVYLAMAEIQDSKYYLFDEPTTYLDIAYQFEFLNHLLQWKQQGKMCLVVLHDLEAALQIADQVLILDQGKIVFFGKSKELLEQKILDSIFQIQVRCMKDEEGKEWYHFCPNQGY